MESHGALVQLKTLISKDKWRKVLAMLKSNPSIAQWTFRTSRNSGLTDLLNIAMRQDWRVKIKNKNDKVAMVKERNAERHARLQIVWMILDARKFVAPTPELESVYRQALVNLVAKDCPLGVVGKKLVVRRLLAIDSTLAFELSKDKKRLPLHIAAGGKVAAVALVLVAQFSPREFAAQSSEQLICMLLKANEGACTVKDTDGCLPLHILCSSKQASRATATLLYRAAPEALNVQDNMGSKPLQLAKSPSVKEFLEKPEIDQATRMNDAASRITAVWRDYVAHTAGAVDDNDAPVIGGIDEGTLHWWRSLEQSSLTSMPFARYKEETEANDEQTNSAAGNRAESEDGE